MPRDCAYLLTCLVSFTQRSSHDVEVEYNLRESAKSEGTGQIPLESTAGVINLSDGNLQSLHLNLYHPGVTKPPSAVDALNHPGPFFHFLRLI